MTKLEEVFQLLTGEIADREARCTIVDEGQCSESSLMATRDGYLRLAEALIKFLIECDAGGHQERDGYRWDDAIKETMFQLPTESAWIVGMYLFNNRRELISAIAKVVDPQVAFPIENDPQFIDTP